MPRKSLEDRTLIPRDGRGFRGHPAPPGLSLPAKDLWRGITASKPHDWFDAGSLPLLVQYCELAVQAELLMARRRALPPLVSDEDDVAAARLERRIGLHVKLTTTLAQKLRLSVQSVVRRDAGKLDEKRPGGHRLLGGNVTRLKPRGAAKPTPGEEAD